MQLIFLTFVTIKLITLLVEGLGGDVGGMQERWHLVEKHVTAPRAEERHLIERGLQSRKPVGYYRYNEEPFRVRRKDFWPLPQAGKLLSEFIPKLSHECDGLIFQVSFTD